MNLRKPLVLFFSSAFFISLLLLIPTFRFEKGKGNGEPTGSSFLCTGRMGEIQVEITRPSIGRLGRKVEAAGKKKFVVIDWLLHFLLKMDSKRLVQRENQFSFRSHMPAYLKEKMLSALFGETSGLGMTLLRYGSDDVPLF